MKIYHFDTPDGDVDMKVDILGSNVGINATIMEIKLTPIDMTEDEFLRAYPFFAGVQLTVSNHETLKAIAVDNNLTLKIFDQDGTPVTVNTSTTTTTTSTTSTTTTTTTAAPTTTTTTTIP